MIITSVKNENILKIKAKRDEKNILFLDNPKLIFEAFISKLEFLYVIIKQDTEFDLKVDCEKLEVSENVFNVFTNTKTSQGVIAVCKYSSKQAKKPSGNFLVLDNIQDPGNVGTLIRSAKGADFLDVYLLNCASVTNDKVVRSTMGALFSLNIYEIKNDDVNFLKDFNLPIFVADMNGEDIFKSHAPLPCGLIVGNEGNGVRKELKELATNVVKIPMLNGLESLNAAVSGSIIMYILKFGGR